MQNSAIGNAQQIRQDQAIRQALLRLEKVLSETGAQLGTLESNVSEILRGGASGDGKVPQPSTPKPVCSPLADYITALADMADNNLKHLGFINSRIDI